MRLGNTLKADKVYALPARDGFDVVATSDISSFRTVVEGVNPFDVSPGIKLILDKLEARPKSANPYVAYTQELNMSAGEVDKLTDSQGNTLLHVAAAHGCSTLVAYLAGECRCDVDAYNKGGYTAVHLAARGGHLSCVQELCKHGANPLSLTSFGDTFEGGRSAVFLAHWHQHSLVREYLMPFFLEYSARQFPASNSDDEDVLQSVLHPSAEKYNVTSLALLFDTLDSVACHDGPLPFNWIHRSVPQVANIVQGWTPKPLPPNGALLAEQNFALKGLLRRGFLDDQITVKSPLVQATLACRSTELFVALFERGLRWSPSELDSCLEDDQKESDVSLLIKEYEARRYSEDALTAYRISQRQHIKSEALEAKRTLKRCSEDLRKRQLKPLCDVK